MPRPPPDAFLPHLRPSSQHPETKSLLDVLDKRLQDRPYLGGAEYSNSTAHVATQDQPN